MALIPCRRGRGQMAVLYTYITVHYELLNGRRKKKILIFAYCALWQTTILIRKKYHNTCSCGGRQQRARSPWKETKRGALHILNEFLLVPKLHCPSSAKITSGTMYTMYRCTFAPLCTHSHSIHPRTPVSRSSRLLWNGWFVQCASQKPRVHRKSGPVVAESMSVSTCTVSRHMHTCRSSNALPNNIVRLGCSINVKISKIR